MPARRPLRAAHLALVAVLLLIGGRPAAPARAEPGPADDPRAFVQTGYRVADDAFWDYFSHRGGVRTFGYPVDIHPQTARTVQPTYTQGFLTTIPGYGSISYHPNLLVNQVLHDNDVTETQANDPNAMRRPASISAAGAAANWTTGTYSYDGAGNVTKIGA